MFGHSHLQDGTFTDRVINVSKTIRSYRAKATVHVATV